MGTRTGAVSRGTVSSPPFVAGMTKEEGGEPVLVTVARPSLPPVLVVGGDGGTLVPYDDGDDFCFAQTKLHDNVSYLARNFVWGEEAKIQYYSYDNISNNVGGE